jgi:hypothetical protein
MLVLACRARIINSLLVGELHLDHVLAQSGFCSDWKHDWSALQPAPRITETPGHTSSLVCPAYKYDVIVVVAVLHFFFSPPVDLITP